MRLMPMARMTSPDRKTCARVVAFVVVAAAARAGDARAEEASRQCFSVAESEPLAARVNEIRISLSALERFGHVQYGGISVPQTLERLISDAVVESEARRQGLGVTSGEIEAAAARNYPKAPQQSGLRLLEADMRGEVCTRLLRDRLYAKVTGGPEHAGAAEARAYYDAHPDEFAPKAKVDHEPSPGPPPFEQVKGRAALAIEQKRRSAWEKTRNAMRDRAVIQRYTGDDGKLRPVGLAAEPAVGLRFPSTTSLSLFAVNGHRGMTCPSGAARFVAEPAALLFHDPHYGALVDGVAPLGTPVSVCEQHQGWSYVSFRHAGRFSVGFLPAEALSHDEPTPSAMLAAIEAVHGDREAAGVWAERYLGAIRHEKAAVVPDDRGAFGGEAAVREALAAAGKQHALRDFDDWLRGRGAFDVALCDGDGPRLFWIARFSTGEGLREAPHATRIAQDDINPDDDPDADAGQLTATNWYLPRAGGTLEPAVGGEPPYIRRWPAGYDPPSDMDSSPSTTYRSIAGCAETGRLMATMPAFAVTEPGARANDALRRACARFGGGAKASAEWMGLGTDRAVLVGLATCATATRIVIAVDGKGNVSSVRATSHTRRGPAPQQQLKPSP